MNENISVDFIRNQLADLSFGSKLRLGVGSAALIAASIGVFVDGSGGANDAPEQLTSFDACTPKPDIASKPEIIGGEGESDVVRGFSLMHTVQKGDESLSKIAECYFPDAKTGLASILASNPGLKDPNKIKPGENYRIWITDAETRLSNEDRSIAEIAKLTGYDAQALATINRVKPDGTIKAGTPIVLPRQQTTIGGEKWYVVHSGDTYSEIAQKFDADIVLLQAANPMDAAKLQPGQIVVIPSGDRGETPPSDEPTTSSEPKPGETPTPPSAEQPPEAQLKEFVETYGPYAKEVEDKYGVPQALVLGIAFHESDYGRSELATKANNFHGLKANGSWDGETYDKKTEEYYDDAQLAEAEAEGKQIEKIDEVDGKHHVYIIDTFRQFDSAEDGFLGLGEKLKGEGNYPDAFDTDDPYEFLSRLVDDDGPKYATDPNYEENVGDAVRRVEQVEYRDHTEPTPESPELPKGTIKERIDAVELSVKGFEAFKDVIDTSYMDDAADYNTYNPETNGIEQESSELFIWHFTTLYYNGPGEGVDESIGEHASVEHFLTSTNGSGVAIQFFIDRSGQTYQLTKETTRTLNIPPHDSVSTGVEVESDKQENITTEQYTSAAYLAVKDIIDQGLLDDGEHSLDEILYGHAEIRAIDLRTDPTLQGRTDFPAAESAELRIKVAGLLKDLGYDV